MHPQIFHSLASSKLLLSNRLLHPVFPTIFTSSMLRLTAPEVFPIPPTQQEPTLIELIQSSLPPAKRMPNIPCKDLQPQSRPLGVLMGAMTNYESYE
ncbi:unnamed protein product [Sphenostylis stenocarpa]|uniref:Uncharacterized protein n=1 Tax=Sphenostylis stenocarpa TaxID=92480 RepID=A0AA86STX2_9FABA|nr:unnamed protein product [Sphenostylis stenocarpa]